MVNQDIVLIHGIRTHARWYERAKQILEEIDGVRVHPIKYGYFNLLYFLVPGPWRSIPIRIVKAKISPILAARDENRSTTFICHSNGTHVASELLRRHRDIEIDNLIICGSVVNQRYDWNETQKQISGSIINEFGARDIWPVVANSISFGYGNTGTNGIGDPVEDRIHDCGHSDYFETNFIDKFWVPFVRDRTFVPSYDFRREIPQSPWWFYFFEFPWKYVIFPLLTAALILLGVWSALAVSQGPETADRYMQYYYGRLPPGYHWEGGEEAHDACIGTAEAKATCREKDRLFSTNNPATGFIGKPDVFFQICPGGRGRDKGAALRALIALRSVPDKDRAWGFLKYRRYKHGAGEPNLIAPNGVRVTIFAPQPIDSKFWSGKERKRATNRLRAELSALPFVPDGSIDVVEHRFYNGIPYHVVFCSTRILGL